MQFLDTQVLSYAFKGIFEGHIRNNAVSSIAASEFLLQQHENPTQASYYIPSKIYMRPINYHYYSRLARSGTTVRNRLNKFITDKVVMEFGLEHGTIIHYSNNSLAHVINTRNNEVFFDAISVVEKNKRKLIMRKFDFLLDNDIVCKPIGENTVKTGYDLLAEFQTVYKTKENFRNSWNDILIFSVALQASTSLVTYDSLLSKFIAAKYATSSSELQNHFSLLDFAEEEKPKKRIRSESKVI